MAIPSRVVSIEEYSATVECFGVERTVSTLLLSEPVTVGDFLTVMAGTYAIEKVSREVAAETLAYLENVLREPAASDSR
jgi:hydrogenase expression/formation protein HypC